RSAYAYDNVLYIVAGEIVPAVAGLSWDDFVTRRILTPLGMSETGTTMAYFTSSRNAAAPHAMEGGTLQIVPIDSVDNTAPAGGLAGMSSQITLVPAEKLGIVILTNSEADLMAALSYRLLDDFLGGGPRTDWVAAFLGAAELDRAQADSTVRATRAARDSLSK